MVRNIAHHHPDFSICRVADGKVIKIVAAGLITVDGDASDIQSLHLGGSIRQEVLLDLLGDGQAASLLVVIL